MKLHMKIRLVSLLLLGIAVCCWAAGQGPLRLELESSVRTLRLGQTTQLKLKIIGSGVYAITEGTEGIDADNMKAGAFVYQFDFKPQRTGTFTFGPYGLSVNGEKLTSNRVLIEVLPQWDGTYGTFFRVDTNSILLGSDVELVAETWAKKYEHKSIFLDRKDTFASSAGGTSSLSFRTGSEGEVTYMRRSWLVTPLEPGVFKIDRQLFKEFPEDVTPPDITVTVHGPAQ